MRAEPHTAELSTPEVVLLLEAIYRRYHVDFRRYAPSSIRRRLAHALVRLHCPTVSELQVRVLADPQLFGKLLDCITVQVTEMFRDPSYFRALREQVLPMLATHPSLKIWVAGCSTGEEAYSLAILLDEADLLTRTTLYATDINTTSLAVAASGIYEQGRLAKGECNYRDAGGLYSLSHYYATAYGQAIFDRRLARHIQVWDHDLATDMVFAEVQLVSCRNVLIYFDRHLQRRVTGLFRDALSWTGFLGLGQREAVACTGHGADFTEFDNAQRIYRRAAW